MNVVVVARNGSRRQALVRRAEESGLTVLADVATEEALPAGDLDGVDAIVLDDRDVESWLTAREVDPLPARALANEVVLVFAESGETAEKVAGLGSRGWVVAPEHHTGLDIVALVSAAACGFGVVAAEWAARARGSEPLARASESMDELVEPLTPRERDVLEQLAAGLSNRRIADVLGISEHTVKFHVSAIFGKLGVSTRAAAVRHAVRHGLVTV